MTWVHYASEVDPADINNAHTLAGLMVPGGSRVLDVGTGVGAVAEFLASRGCRIWGIEADGSAAARAARWCVRVVHADVETLDLDREFADERFGTILCLDVLEHLKDPAATLRRVVRYLEPGGQVLVSLPNVTHASVRLQMLHGRFPRTDAGLLDRTHLQFFDRAAALELIDGAGLRVVQELRVVKRPDETEIPYELGGLSDELIGAATDGPDATTYQFIFAAVGEEDVRSADAPALATVLQQRLHETLDRQATTTHWARSLEQEHIRLQTEVAELTQAVDRGIRERDEARREAAAADAAAAREAAARAEVERRIDHLVGRVEHAVTTANDLALLREQVARAEAARAIALAELDYERRVAGENARRQEDLDRRSRDLTVALVARAQQVADLDRQLSEAHAVQARLRREVTFLQNDRILKDGFVAELRGRLQDATQRAAESAAHVEHEAGVQVSRAAARVREIEQRLAQPRYAFADRVNARLKSWTLVHRVLKAWVPGVGRRPSDS